MTNNDGVGEAGDFPLACMLYAGIMFLLQNDPVLREVISNDCNANRKVKEITTVSGHTDTDTDAEYTHVCAQCGKKFGQKSNLTTHITRAHTDPVDRLTRQKTP